MNSPLHVSAAFVTMLSVSSLGHSGIIIDSFNDVGTPNIGSTYAGTGEGSETGPVANGFGGTTIEADFTPSTTTNPQFSSTVTSALGGVRAVEMDLSNANIPNPDTRIRQRTETNSAGEFVGQTGFEVDIAAGSVGESSLTFTYGDLGANQLNVDLSGEEALIISFASIDTLGFSRSSSDDQTFTAILNDGVNSVSLDTTYSSPEFVSGPIDIEIGTLASIAGLVDLSSIDSIQFDLDITFQNDFLIRQFSTRSAATPVSAPASGILVMLSMIGLLVYRTKAIKAA